MAESAAEQAPATPTPDLFVEVAAQQKVNELIQLVGFPEPVHIGFAESQGAMDQDAPVGCAVEHPHVPGRIAIDTNPRLVQQLANRARWFGMMGHV
jgi:hypothetical protein